MYQPVFQPTQWDGGAWKVWVANPAPGVLQSRASGLLDQVAVSHLMQSFDRVATTAAKVDAFHDWDGVNGYASEARERYTAWSKAHRHLVNSVNILVHSRILAMGIAVANIALGGYLTPYADRAKFDAARDAAVRRRTEEARTPA